MELDADGDARNGLPLRQFRPSSGRDLSKHSAGNERMQSGTDVNHERSIEQVGQSRTDQGPDPAGG